MSTTEYDYDVIVIGAGPAGYFAAVRCAQLGLKTACIDKKVGSQSEQILGGAYVNAGCISAIALLESSKLFKQFNINAADHGITATGLKLDLSRMQQRKESIISSLNQQIAQIFIDNQVESISAEATLINPHRIEITKQGDSLPQVITADKVILAAGSSSTELAIAKIDNHSIINTKQALSLEKVPKKLGIIGAGAIGLELACIWKNLGSEVILLEAQNSFMTIADQDISTEALSLFQQQGLDIRIGARVISTESKDKQVFVTYEDSQGTHHCQFDQLIVASGRKPNTETLIAGSADLLLDEEGFVHVDENCCTTLPGVYAIGDLTLSGPMLAHKGIEEGIFAAEHITGQHSPINYHTIPNVIYTQPEIAWVGQTEQALRAIGEPIKVSQFPFNSNSRAKITGQTEGRVKMIIHAETEVILGVHIIGPAASELIAEAVLAMEFSATAEDLARTIHAHPTYSESLHECALSLNSRSLHVSI
ncbi:MAG: dihydrolipoyl dehydrogenase [Methyloprofundus sp.]|nr:dihydrolipoyl dehydrogenase [Methyloprofundus sp.]